jgi:hypothetical protein
MDNTILEGGNCIDIANFQKLSPAGAGMMQSLAISKICFIAGVQPYFNPTRRNMEDDLNILKMEDNLNLFQMEEDLFFW